MDSPLILQLETISEDSELLPISSHVAENEAGEEDDEKTHEVDHEKD